MGRRITKRVRTPQDYKTLFTLTIILLLVVIGYLIYSRPLVQEVDKQCIVSCAAKSVHCSEQCSNNRYFEMARNNDKLCEKITNSEMRVNCYDSVFRSQAENQRDLVLCEKISNSVQVYNCKESIIQKNAMDSGDINNCDNLNDESRKQACMQTFIINDAMDSLDISKCDELGSVRDSCKNTVLEALAQDSMDDSYCQQINDEERSQICVDRFIRHMAVEFNDATMCEQITDDGQQQACHREFNKLEITPDRLSTFQRCSKDCSNNLIVCEGTC